MTDRERARARVDSIIAERFEVSLMSDTKWVRVFDALTAHAGLVARCRAKLVWDEELRELQIDGRSFEFDYWPHAMEAMLSGSPRGWYDYKELEWILFPPGSQDLQTIGAVIESRGRFDLERSPRGLRLHAYR